MSQQINFFLPQPISKVCSRSIFFSFLDILSKHLLMPSLFNYYPHITSEIIHGLEPLNHCVTAQWIPRGKQGPYKEYSSHTIADTGLLCTFFHSQFLVTAYLSIQSFCSLETVSRIHCLFKSIPFPLIAIINITSKGETWIPEANLNPFFLLSCIFSQLLRRSGFIFTLILFVCFPSHFPSVLSIPSLVLPFFHGSSECL